MGSRLESVWSSPLGRMIMGVLKVALASFLIAMLNTLKDLAGDITIGDIVVPVGTIMALIIGFFPILLLFSAMSDLGVKL